MELVTVVEHPAFAKLNQEELMQEGLPIEFDEKTTLLNDTLVKRLSKSDVREGVDF